LVSGNAILLFLDVAELNLPARLLTDTSFAEAVFGWPARGAEGRKIQAML
jgi:hypothetical protein